MERADRAYLVTGVALLLIILVWGVIFYAGVRPTDRGSNLSYVTLPDGFHISTYVDNFSGSGVSYPGPNPGPRLLQFHDAVLYASLPAQGRIVALPDEDSDGTPEPVTVVDGLDRPHGFAFHDGQLYVAETGAVKRFTLDGLTVAGPGTAIVDELPAGGQHWTRTLRIHNGSMFISVGSSCNVCREEDPWRAAITRCDLDGANCSVYARGLRNAVGMTFADNTLYVTENGRDHLGNDLPPDEINVVRNGDHYGWPECYGKNVPDPRFYDPDRQYVRAPCSEPFEQPSTVNLQAHSAPLGLTFYDGASYPAAYHGDLFVAYHGSWNRQSPTGYKVVRIPRHANGSLGSPQDFATGWLGADGSVRGRPVDVTVGPDGALYVSDDNTGRIYRIQYR